MKYLLKNLLIVFLVFLSIAGFFALLNDPVEKPEQISLNQLVEQINQEQVLNIVIEDNKLQVELKDGTKEIAIKEKRNFFD